MFCLDPSWYNAMTAIIDSADELFHAFETDYTGLK